MPRAAPAPGGSDLLGAALSALCIVHCVSVPGLLVAMPAAGAVVGGFHPVLLVGVTLVAAWAFVPGFLVHRAPSVLVLAALGLALLALGALVLEESRLETVVSVAGAGAMLAAHLRNRTLLRTVPPLAA